jgi:hypothetical protein
MRGTIIGAGVGYYAGQHIFTGFGADFHGGPARDNVLTRFTGLIGAGIGALIGNTFDRR